VFYFTRTMELKYAYTFFISFALSPSVFPIEIYTITEDNALHRLRQSLYLGGCTKQVDMIHHKAVGENSNLLLF